MKLPAATSAYSVAGGRSGRSLRQPAHWSGDVDTLADMVVKTVSLATIFW